MLGVPKKILYLINKRLKAFGSISEIRYVLNKQGTLNPIWTGIFASLKRLGRREGSKLAYFESDDDET